MAKAKPKAAEAPKPKAVPKSVSFHFDEAFRPYLPVLEVFASEQGLDLGPAARELVKVALDRPKDEPSPTVSPELAEEVASVRDAVKALELGVKMSLDENRGRFDRLRDELAQVLRLAFLAFKDLEAGQVEELVRSVFKE
ncbi:MAG TPA: hypothetical protein VH643_18445 [Gemmataceae bacterium]|jgi:hypothetical protein